MATQIISSLLILFTTLSLITKITGQQNDPLFLGWNCEYSAGNYTLDSPYHTNLLSAFSNLTSLSKSNTFSNITIGTNGDRVYALYDCRLDLTLQMCNDCVKDATKNLLQLCPSKEAIATYEECMLRYANRPISALMELEPPYRECDITIPDGGELTRKIKPIFTQLITQATSENSSRYFGVKDTKYFDYQTIYCLVQCTPDISRDQCNECLMDTLNGTLECANATGMISFQNRPSCQMRYDVIRFFNLSSAPPPLGSNSTSSPILSPQLRNKTSSDGGQRLLSSYERFISITSIYLFLIGLL